MPQFAFPWCHVFSQHFSKRNIVFIIWLHGLSLRQNLRFCHLPHQREARRFAADLSISCQRTKRNTIDLHPFRFVANQKEPFLSERLFRFLAAELGFEPRQTESETVVLPLHNSAMFITGIIIPHSRHLSRGLMKIFIVSPSTNTHCLLHRFRMLPSRHGQVPIQQNGTTDHAL